MRIAKRASSSDCLKNDFVNRLGISSSSRSGAIRMRSSSTRPSRRSFTNSVSPVCVCSSSRQTANGSTIILANSLGCFSVSSISLILFCSIFASPPFSLTAIIKYFRSRSMSTLRLLRKVSPYDDADEIEDDGSGTAVFGAPPRRLARDDLAGSEKSISVPSTDTLLTRCAKPRIASSPPIPRAKNSRSSATIILSRASIGLPGSRKNTRVIKAPRRTPVIVPNKSEAAFRPVNASNRSKALL